MLIRGSARLLLLFLRSRPRLGWTAGCTALILLLATALQASGEFPLMTRSGLAQLLRQSAWEHALASLPEQAPWPWADTSAEASGGVPQLGLSAVIKEGHSGETQSSAIQALQRASGQDPHLPEMKFGEAGIGDRITTTAAGGASQVFAVTGCKVVDPHLADPSSGAADDRQALANCLPLDPGSANSLKLMIQGTKIEPPAPLEPQPEQKL
jgi:hypothetical protein